MPDQFVVVCDPETPGGRAFGPYDDEQTAINDRVEAVENGTRVALVLPLSPPLKREVE